MIGPSDTDWGEKALQSAVHRDIRALEEALDHDANSVSFWKEKDEIWPTPLLASAYVGHLEAVLLLLARGANPLVRSTAKFTVLHYLASYCDSPFEELYPVMKMLIEK